MKRVVSEHVRKMDQSKWLLVMECKGPAEAARLLQDLKIHALGEFQTAVLHRVYAVYGTDLILLRSLCKRAVELKCMEEKTARNLFEQEVAFALARTSM